MNITRERFNEIFDDEDIMGSGLYEEGCNALKGLLIVSKYTNKSVVDGAGHDIIYSVDIDKIIKAGITEEDVIELSRQNWMNQNDSLACFV